LRLVIENFDPNRVDHVEVPNHPQKPELGKRTVPFSRELWIERDDYEETPPKGYKRLSPGAEVRLRYGYVVKCIGMKDGAVHCTYYEDSRSGTPEANRYKPKGNIHWVSAPHALKAKVRLYDRLYRMPQPSGVEDLNPDSVKSVTALLETSLKDAAEEERFQFERKGYFTYDAAHGVFNRTVTLRD
jgi:glutaminyl-tRNA synthetase